MHVQIYLSNIFHSETENSKLDMFSLKLIW